MSNPLFNHDCEHCEFIKTGKDEFGRLADIYVCGNCVTFRYSNELPDNRSICFNDKGAYSEWYKEVNPYPYKILQEYLNIIK